MGGLGTASIWVGVRESGCLMFRDFGSYWTNLNSVLSLVLEYFLFAKKINFYFVFGQYK